jgi:hypothetical protein
MFNIQDGAAKVNISPYFILKMRCSGEYQPIFNSQDGAALVNISPGFIFKMTQLR